MDIKISIVVVVVSLHVFFPTNCHSFPYWDYLFDEEDTDTKTETEVKAESNPVIEPEPITASVPENQPIPSTEIVNTEVIKSATSTTPKRDRPPRRNRVRAKPDNGAAIPMAPMGLLANIMTAGKNGLKTVVETGTGLGTSTVDQAGRLNNAVIDQTQNVIQQGTQRSVDTIVPWMSQLDTYRRAFSGGTKSNADKAHSITITTSSDAPINSMYGFMKDFMPAGTGKSSALPPVTSVDFSQFLRR